MGEKTGKIDLGGAKDAVEEFRTRIPKDKEEKKDEKPEKSNTVEVNIN